MHIARCLACTRFKPKMLPHLLAFKVCVGRLTASTTPNFHFVSVIMTDLDILLTDEKPPHRVKVMSEQNEEEI